MHLIHHKIYTVMSRNGHISAASDAKQHIDALIASLDDEEVDLPEFIDA